MRTIQQVVVLLCFILCVSCAHNRPQSLPQYLKFSGDAISLQLKATAQFDNAHRPGSSPNKTSPRAHTPNKKIHFNVHLKAHKNKHLRLDVFSIFNTHEASVYLNTAAQPARLQILLLRQNKLHDLKLKPMQPLPSSRGLHKNGYQKSSLAKNSLQKNKMWALLSEVRVVYAVVFRHAIELPGWRCVVRNHTPQHCHHGQKNIHVRWSSVRGWPFISIQTPDGRIKLQVVDFWPDVKRPQKAFQFFKL